MRIRVISCEVFARELCLAASVSPHVVDIKLMHFGLHNTPEKLREALQTEIDATDAGVYDHIILGYGLCSRGTAQLTARAIPMVIPRMHDCITAFLGSREAYNREFGAHPGTYYYSAGWIERREGESDEEQFQDAHARAVDERYKEYLEKYGEDNAKFLIEQESQWLANYSRAALIDTGVGDIVEYRRFTKQLADDHGWEYAEIEGDASMISRLANGEWDGDEFLIVRPGQSIVESFDELALRAEEPI